MACSPSTRATAAERRLHELAGCSSEAEGKRADIGGASPCRGAGGGAKATLRSQRTAMVCFDAQSEAAGSSPCRAGHLHRQRTAMPMRELAPSRTAMLPANFASEASRATVKQEKPWKIAQAAAQAQSTVRNLMQTMRNRRTP